MLRVESHTSAAAKSTELLLWLAAAACFITLGYALLSAHQASQASAGQSAAPAIHAGDSSPTHTRNPLSSSEKPAAGDVIGRLEIPKLALSVPMTAGIESSSLIRGVGHIEGTAMPGGLGTLGLAGHRDTWFRPLRRIAPGMEVRVIDRTGTYHYSVDSTEIVNPEQVEVLSIRSRPELTLITCYPFDYVGAAPQRFIVHAHLLSAAPDEPH